MRPRRKEPRRKETANSHATGWTEKFAIGIGANMPALRRYARRLRGNSSGAEDLVQDCMLCALTKWPHFQPGTNLRDWLFTVMHGIHVNQPPGGASAAPGVEDETPIAGFADAAPNARLAFGDFVRAFAALSAER